MYGSIMICPFGVSWLRVCVRIVGSAGALGVTMTYFMVRSCRITLLSILISRNHFGSMTFLVEKFFYSNGVKHYCEVIYRPLYSVIF